MFTLRKKNFSELFLIPEKYVRFAALIYFVQEVMSSTRLLSDMLEQEGVATGQGEREIMADLYQVIL